MRPADARPWLWPAAAALLFGWLQATGRAVFWGDLTYIHHPWRTLIAQQLAEGKAPLWDPYLYLGMPLAGEMQSAAWYPGTLPFFLFPFDSALNLFLAVHYGLASFLAFLWLRRGGASPAAALGGAATYAATGVLASRVPFLNHLSTLALVPALLLFAERPWLIGLSAALAFLSGYPLMLAGGAASAWVISWICGRGRPSILAWIAGIGLAAGLGSLLLWPAAQLAADSQRGAGIPLDETLQFGLAPADLGGFIAPWLSRTGGSAAIFWWKACWFGVAAALAIVAAVPRLKGRALWGLGLYAAVVVGLALGGSNPASDLPWRHLPFLKFVRYPGNMTYLLLPAAALAVAAGLHRRRYAGAWAVVIAVEAVAYAAASQPLMPGAFFAEAGPLVRSLQDRLDGHRYLLSPQALESHSGRGSDPREAVRDLKRRLYGLTNAPYRIHSLGNFGEPLVPRACYDVMDFMYSRLGFSDAARYLPWLDATVLLTKDRHEPAKLRYEGELLWHAYRSDAALGRAFWLPEGEGQALPSELAPFERLPALASAKPVLFQSGGDRFRVLGDTPAGWVYVSEPRVPGWTAWLDGRPVETEPAWRAFHKVRVPAGAWRLDFRYRPRAFALGLLVTLLVLGGSVAFWYNKVRRTKLSAISSQPSASL